MGAMGPREATPFAVSATASIAAITNAVMSRLRLRTMILPGAVNVYA